MLLMHAMWRRFTQRLFPSVAALGMRLNLSLGFGLTTTTILEASCIKVDITNLVRITRTGLHVAASTASDLTLALGSVTMPSVGGRSKLRCVSVPHAAEGRRPMKDR